jgi:hypothetical protein
MSNKYRLAKGPVGLTKPTRQSTDAYLGPARGRRTGVAHERPKHTQFGIPHIPNVIYPTNTTRRLRGTAAAPPNWPPVPSPARPAKSVNTTARELKYEYSHELHCYRGKLGR